MSADEYAAIQDNLMAVLSAIENLAAKVSQSSKSSRMSEEVGELFTALAAAQGEFPAVTKDNVANIGTYKYKYADLGMCIEAIRNPLANHGLGVLQPTIPIGESTILRTMLTHKSGQFIASDLKLPISEAELRNPQLYGKVLTYFRRYALCSLLMIAQEDDDAQSVARVAEDRQPIARPDPRPRTVQEPPFEPERRETRPRAQEARQEPARPLPGQTSFIDQANAADRIAERAVGGNTRAKVPPRGQ